MNDDEDFGSEIDDAEFVAIATQAEQQFASRTAPESTNANNLLPSDDFDDAEIDFSSFSEAPAPLGGSLRQTKLFGRGTFPDAESSQSLAPRRNWPLASKQEPPTHHKLDRETAKTWVYPVNVSYRDYQYNIVRRALLSNVLCALPTGGFIRCLLERVRLKRKLHRSRQNIHRSHRDAQLVPMGS
jgi:ATP-dependent DNA helicase MPH1